MGFIEEVIIIIKKTSFLFLACAIASLVVGCSSIGQTPAGGSDAEVRAAFDKQPLDVRAKEIMGSPAPMDYKVKRIKDMYAKEGKPVPPELLQGGGAVPQGGANPGSSK